LFNEVIGKLLTKCSKLVDDKIKELVSKFHYAEEKIIFNSDTILSFLINSPDININVMSTMNEININIKQLCDQKASEYDTLVKKTKPEWKKIKKEKILKINQFCNNYKEKIISDAFFQDNIKNVNEDELKSLIMDIPDLYQDVESYKKEEINLKINEIIQRTIERIISHKNSLKNWDLFKVQLMQQAYIEMIKKSKENLGSDLNQVINNLMNHIDNLPNFYNECKTEERKNEIRKEIRINAEIVAEEYINGKKFKEQKEKANKEEKQRLINMYEESEKRRIKFEKELKEERKRREEEEIKRQNQEKELRKEKEKQKEIERQREMEKQKQREENQRQREMEKQNKNCNQFKCQQKKLTEEEITNLAGRAINGEFGNGETRKRKLGPLYKQVQNKVNELLGNPKRH
jgi:hypothetical protein